MLVKSGDHRGTVTDGHKMVSKHVTPLIKKLSLLLFFYPSLRSYPTIATTPSPKNTESNSLLDHPSPSCKSVSSVKTRHNKKPKSTTFPKFPPVAKLAFKRAKCSAVFFPLVTCFWTKDPKEITPQIDGGSFFSACYGGWVRVVNNEFFVEEKVNDWESSKSEKAHGVLSFIG